MKKKEKQRLLANRCVALFKLDKDNFNKCVPSNITIEDIFKDCHTIQAIRLRIKQLPPHVENNQDLFKKLSYYFSNILSDLIEDHINQTRDNPDKPLMKRLLTMMQPRWKSDVVWMLSDSPYSEYLYEEEFDRLSDITNEDLLVISSMSHALDIKQNLYYRLSQDAKAHPFLKKRLKDLSIADLKKPCFQDENVDIRMDGLLLNGQVWYDSILEDKFYEKIDWGVLCLPFHRNLFFHNEQALLKSISLETLLRPNESSGVHAGASLFCLLMDDERARPFLEEKIQGLTQDQLKMVCRDTKIAKHSVAAVLLSDLNWHDYLLTKEIYQTMNWEEAIEKDVESVLPLAQTESGREILLRDDAKLLKRIPQKEISVTFMLGLFEVLDKSEALQKLLKDKESHFYQSLFDNFQAREKIKLNTMVGSSVDAPRGAFAKRLNSPALMLAQTAFGRQCFLEDDALFDALSDEAMVMTDDEGVSVLSCFLVNPALSSKVLKRSAVFRAVDEIRLYDSRSQTKDMPKRLVDVILAHPNCMTILLKEGAHCLSLLKKKAQDFLFETMSETELVSQLAGGMSTLTSFNNIQAFLFASCRMDCLKASVFQRAIAMLFMTLIDKAEITPDSFRQFTQYMEKEAYNQLNAFGGSVVYYLSQYKEGIALIKNKGLVSMLDEATLVATIDTGNAETLNLRDILRDECGIMFQTAGGSLSTFFKMSH